MDSRQGGQPAVPNDAGKLQQHLELLREEYKKLQLHANNVESKLALTSSDKTVENCFLRRLYKTVCSLHDSSSFSDLKIELKNKTVPVHKLVFYARSHEWGVPSLADATSLDWKYMELGAANALIMWIYTDQVDFQQSDEFSLTVMKYANQFKLQDLVNRCEMALIGSVNIKNCVRYYSTANEIGAQMLMDHCSSLISTYWENFTSEDFKHMSAHLLYHMFKTKTKFPLHAAVRLQRDDVVFLYLVENGGQLKESLNTVDNKGDLPLGLAIQTRQRSIAQTLLESGADPNFLNNEGLTLLHSAVVRGDVVAAKFLIEQKASVELTTRETGDTALHLIASSSPDSQILDETMTALVEIAKLLIDMGLNPNTQNKKGFTALHLAVMTHNEQLFSLLLNTEGVQLDIQTHDESHTPLWYGLIRASSSQLYNCNSFAARLLEKKCNPNPIYKNNNNSLLHRVAAEGWEDVGLFLLNYNITNIDHVNIDNETVLHIACEKDMGRLVAKLLECGAKPNGMSLATRSNCSMGAASQTPLHYAISARARNAVKAFLDHRLVVEAEKERWTADLNSRDSSGNTPLSLAIKCEMESFIPGLIKGGADVNERNEDGLTLLHQAISKGDSNTAIILINNGANIDALTIEEDTPLQLAIKVGLPDVVEAICRLGIDMSVRDKEDNCPLWNALATRKEDIASILVRQGVDTNFWSAGPEGCHQTLLHRAIDENQEQVAKFLIQSGCDVNTPRRPGPGGTGGEEAHDQQTPLHLSCQWGQESVVQTLFEHGANVNVQDIEGKTPLHVAIQNQHQSIINLLLCHPHLDLTIQDKNGMTPFATALVSRNNKAAQAIREKLPTAAEQVDSKGCNFLHSAIRRNDVESVLFLLSINVDVNSRTRDDSQYTPLHLAIMFGNETLVRSLLLANARPNDRDGHKRTPLHIAALSGHEYLVSALLQNGAEYNAIDSEGDNALHLAVREGHFSCIRTLLTESNLDAEAINLKGRNPLHTLARYAKDNAASICELFLECIPNYPLDKPDLDGNTALILAYTKGHGNLCRALVKAGACIGMMNREGVTIFNYQVASNSKTLLKRLLDSLSQEPPWVVDGDICLECGTKFGFTMRKHHCRHCGRLLCSKCSSLEIPILKFNLNKPVRVCGVCFELLHVGAP